MFADSLPAGSGQNWFGSTAAEPTISAAAEPNQFRPDPARKLSA